MRLTIAYLKIKKRTLVLINNDTYQRETLSERPIRPPLRYNIKQQSMGIKFLGVLNFGFGRVVLPQNLKADPYKYQFFKKK